MKRSLSILMICSILVTITAGTATAGNFDYTIIEYTSQTPVYVDGEWSPNDEWFDGLVINMSDTCNYTYNMNFTSYRIQYLIEFFSDDTDDADDYWQICLDSNNTGGTAPQQYQWLINITGHTEMTCYEGTGTGWQEITPDVGEIEWDNSITGTPRDSNDHWILELTILKTSGAIQTTAPDNGMRVAAYDASNSEDGVHSWPPDSDADVPNEWGIIDDFDMTNPIPEGFTFTVMVFLSSVSLLVGSHYLRKRSKK